MKNTSNKFECALGCHEWAQINNDTDWYTIYVCDVCKQFARICDYSQDFIVKVVSHKNTNRYVREICIDPTTMQGTYKQNKSSIHVYQYTPPPKELKVNEI